MTEHAQPIGGSIFTRPFKILMGIFVVGALLLLWRYLSGLGATTGLNDGYPWGIWIAFDVVTGTALACGGYAVAILLYILNKGKYHPLIRPAILTSALGYSIAGAAIAVDVGRYWNIWKIPLFFWKWNLNSVLLEVALCVMAYVIVLWIELSPAFFEKWKDSSVPLLKKASGIGLPFMNKALIWIVALGLLLPTMHQSSLGSVMLVAMNKLSPLWHTPMLPLLFLISCIAMGYAVVIFESTLSSRFFHRKPETKMLGSLSVAMVVVLFLYIVLRFADLLWRSRIGLIFTDGWHSFFFWLEIVLFLAPALMLLSSKMRTNPGSLFLAAMMMILAGGLYRFDTYLVGFNPGIGWSYFPAVPELLITIGLVAFEIMVYIVIVKRFPIISGGAPATAGQGGMQ
jgi:Ni/Fe-hydrogenase subunit HybB-like protein